MSKKNLLNLLESVDEFVVPTIQRDYAQGRDNGSNKELCEEVRTGIIESMYNALTEDKELLLDYIYGANDTNIFYPIDGQQRLTTLFLLHWYLGKKEEVENTNPNEFGLLRKFSYQIRDTSKEFCKALVDIEVDFSVETISDQIKDSAKYHDTYSLDPTVKSMLVVLNDIHAQFRLYEGHLWDRLKKIQFWCLSLAQFGLTDDLFVKMNARGKRLTRFDVFKSDLESRIEKIDPKTARLTNLIEEWRKEIDNTFLDSFWTQFGFEYAERNLFRTILFYVKGLISAQNVTSRHDDVWETDESKVYYYDVIDIIENNNEVLTKACSLLSNFEIWNKTVDGTDLFVDDSATEPKNIVGYNKVIVFGILYWFSFAHKMNYDSNFEQFKRILENYVFSLRQPNITPAKRYYSSNIDNSNVGKAFAFIKELVDGYTDRTKTFNEYLSTTSFKEMDYERKKLSYSALKDIIELEEVPFLKGNISNFYFDGTLYLKKDEVLELASSPTLINKTLRIIYSFADNKYGKFQELLLDKTLIKSGHKQLYYNDVNDQATGYFHKLAFSETDDFGDRNLTSGGNDIYADISDCVKEFVKALSKKVYDESKLIPQAIDELFAERKALSDYSDSMNVKWYIVNYDEFFYDSKCTTLSVLRRKNYGGIDNDNVYDMLCINDDNDFNKAHYNPFYLALCHNLNKQITIDEGSLKYTGVRIDYCHPCTLSNKWTIRINENSNWVIDFHGAPPINYIPDITINMDGFGIIDCNGCDSISKAASVFNSI